MKMGCCFNVDTSCAAIWLHCAVRKDNGMPGITGAPCVRIMQLREAAVA